MGICTRSHACSPLNLTHEKKTSNPSNFLFYFFFLAATGGVMCGKGFSNSPLGKEPNEQFQVNPTAGVRAANV